MSNIKIHTQLGPTVMGSKLSDVDSIFQGQKYLTRLRLKYDNQVGKLLQVEAKSDKKKNKKNIVHE